MVLLLKSKITALASAPSVATTATPTQATAATCGVAHVQNVLKCHKHSHSTFHSQATNRTRSRY